MLLSNYGQQTFVNNNKHYLKIQEGCFGFCFVLHPREKYHLSVCQQAMFYGLSQLFCLVKGKPFAKIDLFYLSR